MKKLYILRHAKAGKSNKKILDDHERPLTDAGIRSCKLIVAYLKKNAIKPDLVISSTSRRTKKTFDNIFNDYLPKLEVEFNPRLYLAGAYDILSIVNEVPDSVEKLLIIGHNPGLQEFCLRLAAESDKSLVKALKDNFPPAALAVFEIKEKSWEDTSVKSGLLQGFITPKSLLSLGRS